MRTEERLRATPVLKNTAPTTVLKVLQFPVGMLFTLIDFVGKYGTHFPLSILKAIVVNSVMSAENPEIVKLRRYEDRLDLGNILIVPYASKFFPKFRNAYVVLCTTICK